LYVDERWESKYYKGLGTSKAIDFEEYFADMDNHLIQINHQDASDSEAIKLLFGKEAGMSDKRKDWLGIEEKA
jgi:DNA topoisomerase-2